jgi:hypothetical protein
LRDRRARHAAMRGSPGGGTLRSVAWPRAHKSDASEPGRTVSDSPVHRRMFSFRSVKNRREKQQGAKTRPFTSLPRRLPIQVSEQRGRPKGPSPRQPHPRLDPSPILAWPMMCENLIPWVGRKHEFVCPTSFRKLVVIGSTTAVRACMKRDPTNHSQNQTGLAKTPRLHEN